MKVELSRFRVKPGKSERVDDWLQMLNSHMDDVVETLEREQMKIEVDEEYGRHDAQPQVVMIPETVALSMAWKSPAKSVKSLERREIILRRNG